MEQTMVDSFFQVQKRNDFYNNPSKRRKLIDTKSMDMNFVKEKVVTSTQKALVKSRPVGRKTRSKSQKSKGCNGVSISALLNAKPMESTEVTSSKDEHGDTPKRKIPSKSVSRVSELNNIEGTASCTQELSTKKTEHVQETERTQNHKHCLKIDPWIVAQSRAVLEKRQSRGNKCEKLCQNESLASATWSEKNDKAEPSPLRPDTNPRQKIRSQRSSLRQKYAHLLEKPADNVSGGSGETKEVCASEIKVPAHQRLKSLAAAESLPFAIPSKFKMLMEQFKCADSILFLLEQRSETCTFDRLKKSIENMSGRNFDVKHLAQMKTVYPDAFIFRQEKCLRKTNGSVFSGYQLTIEANFSNVALKKLDVDKNGKEKLSPTALVTRRAVFESNIIKIIAKHHLKFLHQMNVNVKGKEIKRWHPKFDLENVPNIEEAELPKPPMTNTITSVGDILNKASKRLIPQVAAAVQKVTNKEEDSNNDSSSLEKALNSKNQQEASSTLMAGVSQSLLERIREKEQRKNELAMMRNPEQEKELAMMERLPEMARILKTYFTTEKKCAVAVDDCTQKLTQSYGSGISVASLSEHLTLMSKLVPSWMKIVAVRKCPYVKLVKNTDINTVQQELSIKRKEAMNR